MPIAAFASLLLAAGSPALGDARALDALVDQLYSSYRAGNAPRPQWATSTQQLVQLWQQRHPDADAPPVTEILCACRDWDAPDFHVETLTRVFTGPGRAVMLLRVWPNKRRSGDVRLSLVKEGSRWAVEEIGDPSSGRSLTALLRR